MCTEGQLARMGRRARVDRREFTKIGGLAALAAACTPGSALAQASLTEVAARFPAPGGRMDAHFVHPAQGKHPAVLVWPDGAGLRDSFVAMSRRLARQGYAVLLLNPYYADAEAPQFNDFEDFRTRNGMETIGPWRAKLTQPTVAEVARAAVGFLDEQGAVDTARGVGVQGYCMGGAFAVWSAAAVPERIKAVASFHGGGLVSEAETAPLRMLGQSQARYLFAIARDDDRSAPGDKDALKAAAAAAGRPATVEVFRGDHGWTVDDSPAFELDAADRAWGQLLELYSAAL